MWYKAKTSTNKPQWQMMYDGDGGFPLSGGGWEILLGRLIYMMVDTWGEVILTIWAFFKARHNIL